MENFHTCNIDVLLWPETITGMEFSLMRQQKTNISGTINKDEHYNMVRCK